MKDLLLRYVQLLPHVFCHLKINVGRAIYGQGCFRSFTFLEMWQWYSLYKTLQADPQAGTDHERKMAQMAYCSVWQCLYFTETSTGWGSCSSGSKGDAGWADDTLLVEASSCVCPHFAAGDAGGRKKFLEKEAHPDPPQKPYTDTTAPLSAVSP